MCCPMEIAACQRHLNDLERQGTAEFPYVFDATRADRILRYMESLVQVRGVFAGQTIKLQPWQVFDLGCLYGWVHMETGARRFVRSLSKRGRGNVKSTENSGKALYAMTSDACYPPYQPELAVYEMEPEVECAAVDRSQAMRVLGDAKKIAAATPALAKRLILPRSNPIVHRTRGGFMRALSKDTSNKDSGAACYFCVDEYESHKTSEIYDLGLNSFGKRRQSLLDAIMTAGDDAENKPGKKEEDYARKILLGDVIDETYFVMLRELPPSENPHDKSKWLWANPILRFPDEYSKTLLQQIELEYTAAYSSGDPEKIRKWLTRRMCQWQAAAVNSYLDERCRELARKAMISRTEFATLTDGRSANIGFDLGKRIDLSGVAAVFDLPDGRIAAKMHAFMPENGVIRHERTDRVPYNDWVKRGFCTATPGDVTDNSYIHQWIIENESLHKWEVREVDYDGHNATDLAIQLIEERNREDFCVEIRQTCAGQNQAVKGFREMLLQGRIVLEYSPLALWCLGNAIEIQNNFGDSKLSKKHKDDSQRIDPVAAMMNALARVLVCRTEPSLANSVDKNYSM